MLVSWLVFFTLCSFQVNSPGVYGDEVDTESTDNVNPDDAYTTCSKGWFSFGDMCYKMGGKKMMARLTWEKAAENCREEHNGNLVTIDSKELQDFLTTFLGLSAKGSVWIGLHDRLNETNYIWEDGSPVNYTNWEPHEPTGPTDEKEDCTEMVHRSGRNNGKSGQWNDINCEHEKLFMCQKSRGMKGKKVLDPRYCSTVNGLGWRFEKSCFFYAPEKKTWSEAEEYCAEKHNGNLATIQDFTYNLFLNYILRDKDESMWIGIKIQEKYQQKWSSGWYVSYENWAEDEEEFSEGSCALRDHEGTWITMSCGKKMPFVCEYSTAEPPVLKPSVADSYCPEPKGWRDLGGDFCYYFDTKASITWATANFECMRRGGTLLSIHSEDEVNMLRNFVKYTRYVVLIGLHRHMQYEEEFVWADGSPVDFTMWNPNEPNNDKEQCVEMITETMKWNDVICSNQRGYVCSVRKILPNRTTETPYKSGCMNGFTVSALLGVIFCILFVAALVGVVFYYFRLCDRRYERVKKISGTKMLSTSHADKRPKYRTEITLEEDLTYETMTNDI
ncbi:brevican core protein [Nephila pilipes]|uniref:Brevican core protein n=1 Tax=Nephila pilipes TaxID=299642 RepID=A0A8X6MSE5_NEPPI|nr:brevican core protein [Nephila pilipes]